MGKCTVDNRDDYYRRAKEDGYRARSAYKLIDLDRQFDLLDPHKVRRACDLCAAPGSWSQVLAERLIPVYPDGSSQVAGAVHIVSVDLQRVAPIPGVFVIQGDITSSSTTQEILQRFEGTKADLVLCDGAGELSACVIDEYLQAKLVLMALRIARQIMRPGATFVCKVLVGDSYRGLVERKLCSLFERVETVKPPSSRASSSEHFAVCINMLSDEEVTRGKNLANMMMNLAHVRIAQPSSSTSALSHSAQQDEEDRRLPLKSSNELMPDDVGQSRSSMSADRYANADLFRQFYASYATAKISTPWNIRRQ